jgi:hypothetical protein
MYSYFIICKLINLLFLYILIQIHKIKKINSDNNLYEIVQFMI